MQDVQAEDGRICWKMPKSGDQNYQSIKDFRIVNAKEAGRISDWMRDMQYTMTPQLGIRKS